MEELEWTPDLMLEVTLNEADDFLKVRETLSRIGVASRKERKLYQSCHILHKQGRYFIVHFKELFALDGKPTNISLNDLERRNTIAGLLITISSSFSLTISPTISSPDFNLNNFTAIIYYSTRFLPILYFVSNNHSFFSL